MSQAEAIYGRHPVLETLRAGRRKIHRLLIAETAAGGGPLNDLCERAAQARIPIAQVSRQELDRYHPNHQGVVALAGPMAYCELDEILGHVRAAEEPALVLLLDLIQDPQNLGTLLRTAEAVGVHGVVLGKHHSASVTPAVVSSSSGASEHLHIARANLAQAINRLKQEGLWVLGLDQGPGVERLDQLDLAGPLGVVVGSEGSGLRRLVRGSCDFLARIPMRGAIQSLNAAVAGSIALYEAWKARRFAGEPG